VGGGAGAVVDGAGETGAPLGVVVVEGTGTVLAVGGTAFEGAGFVPIGVPGMGLAGAAGAAAAGGVGGVGVAGFSLLWLINSTSKTSMDLAGIAPWG